MRFYVAFQVKVEFHAMFEGEVACHVECAMKVKLKHESRAVHDATGKTKVEDKMKVGVKTHCHGDVDVERHLSPDV